MDFFTVPTVTFGLLRGFLIQLERRTQMLGRKNSVCLPVFLFAGIKNLARDTASSVNLIRAHPRPVRVQMYT